MRVVEAKFALSSTTPTQLMDEFSRLGNDFPLTRRVIAGLLIVDFEKELAGE